MAPLAAAVLAWTAGSTPARADGYLQCVPFARALSGIQIFGDARTWWGQATGKYEQGVQPKSGAVLVFKPQGAMVNGHVAVVSQVLTDRVIQISHANWSRIGGRRGQIERDVTVIDVSDKGDWSRVKVWYDPLKDLGTSSYPTYGFIYQNAGAVQQASAGAVQQAVRDVAQTMLTAATKPATAPMAAIADTTDRIAALLQAAASGGSGGQD